MSKQVHVTINGQCYTANSDQTILKVAEENYIFIPRL